MANLSSEHAYTYPPPPPPPPQTSYAHIRIHRRAQCSAYSFKVATKVGTSVRVTAALSTGIPHGPMAQITRRLVHAYCRQSVTHEMFPVGAEGLHVVTTPILQYAPPALWAMSCGCLKKYAFLGTSADERAVNTT